MDTPAVPHSEIRLASAGSVPLMIVPVTEDHHFCWGTDLDHLPSATPKPIRLKKKNLGLSWRVETGSVKGLDC